jgi:HD-GYP domain-containing protein (c-di-GMP phosphodiesterase class II)
MGTETCLCGDLKMTQLIIERGPNKGQRIEIKVFPATLGRDAANSIVINDDESSRFHLRIKKRGRLYIIEDLESKNGTYLNGDKILNSIVKNGDKILIGSTELVFATSAPDIQLATEILNFNMFVAEELGLPGPIIIGGGKVSESGHTPIRLNPLTAGNKVTADPIDAKTILDHHGNILVIDDIEEAANCILKSIGQIAPSTSRAALFIWVEANRQLLPIAARQFSKKSKPFILSQRSLEDALARQQGILLQSDSVQTAKDSPTNRIVLPMVQNGQTICVLHLESDSLQPVFPVKELDLLQALIKCCAASFDSLLLRREIDSWMVGMVETVIATIEAKDTYTVGHSERVCRYSMAIAEELKLNRELKKLLMVSSLCHDIGKIGIPDSILKKASLLSADEYDEMKLHPSIGADIMSHMPNASRFISGVKYHHEKWDGTGYPDGLVGEDIPFFGRIVAVADVFDAMVSGRSYSGFVDESNAVEKICAEQDLFDPEIIKSLVRAWDSGALTQRTSTQSRSPNDISTAETAGGELKSAASALKKLKKKPLS